jgi:predicted phosphate transport protein (TIGR00153 family)
MWFRSKQKKIEEQLAEYRKEVSLCLAAMVETFKKCQGSYDRQFLDESIAQVHQAEGKADDIRKEIEVLMYSKSIFPESRGDILGLLEAMDKVPNQAESVVWMLKTHHIVIPAEFQSGIIMLAEICQRCVEQMLEASEKLFIDFTNASVAIGKIDQLESEADVIEAELTDQIFSSELNGTKKLLMRDLILNLAAISDRAENVGDRISIVVAKRRF